MITIARARRCISGNDSLLHSTRHRIAASRRLLNRAFGLSGGGGAPEDPVLRERIRARLLTGELFWASGDSHVRRGTGRPCAVCGQGIAREGIERQVTGPRDTRSAIAHEECWLLWREVCRESPVAPRRSPSRSRLTSSDRGQEAPRGKTG